MGSIITIIIVIFASLGNLFGYSSQNFDETWLFYELYPLKVKLSNITGLPKSEVLPTVFGEDLHFEYRPDPNANYWSCWSSLVCLGNMPFDERSRGILLHELGHKFINDMDRTGADLIAFSLGYYDEAGNYVHVSGFNSYTWRYERTLRGQPHYKNNLDMIYQEDYADMFMSWALDDFSDDEAGRLRYEYINNFILDRLTELGYDIRETGDKTCMSNGSISHTRLIMMGIATPQLR